MKVFLTFRIFLCILILRETCPQNLRGNVTVTDLHLISENIVPMRRVLDRGPYFDTSATKNVTSLVGITGHLNCRIKNLGNKTVSWIRHRDLHLLTVSESTYTSDQRFTSIYNKQTGDWSLQIKFPQLRDSGVYECQVSTTPPVGYTMVFSVVEPITSILGGPEIYIDLGSTVNLTCVIKHLPDPPISVQWNHNNQEINYDSPRGGVSVITEKGDITTSYLLIQRASIADSGQYSCLPSNANSKSVNVHILKGDHPAAVQKSHLLVSELLSLCFLQICLKLSAQ
ncbi:neurotrimin isoform X1 [Drosophila sechellia]|uniref:neurotrimin isoform X1 n=1 Tax=Drosophila sechellia TaxID=7238 RepID=UPI0013DE02C4|nr:neurotrimin isoform X1 [Drosophila sechellia]XP_039148699.1 neurotrimin isoform X2 [Drosophila simulans]XP_039150356.1 neurotrimin-like isoform X2 [Drosophila simulans]